jgi:hypothetical protein
MTLQEAKSIARHLGLTLHRVRYGSYRVNFRDGNETAHYTSDLEDAVNDAVEMARTRRLGPAMGFTGMASGKVGSFSGGGVYPRPAGPRRAASAIAVRLAPAES